MLFALSFLASPTLFSNAQRTVKASHARQVRIFFALYRALFQNAEHLEYCTWDLFVLLTFWIKETDHSTPLLLESRWLADSPHNSWGVIAWLWETLYTAPGKWTGRKSRWENSHLGFNNPVTASKVLDFVFFRVVSAILDLYSILSSKLITDFLFILCLIYLYY